MDHDEFRNLLKASEKLFGDDLWTDSRFRDVKTLIGRSDTAACQIFIYGAFACWLYVLYDLVIANTGWVIGVVLIIFLSFVMYRMPVIHVIQSLEEAELQEYFGVERNDAEDDEDAS